MIGKHHFLCLGSAAFRRKCFCFGSACHSSTVNAYNNLVSTKNHPLAMWNHSNWMIFLDFNLKISVNIEIWDIWLSVKKCQTKSFYLIVNLKISSQFGHHYLQLFMLSEDQPRQKEAIHLTQVCKARKNVNGFLAALPKTKTVECVERKTCTNQLFSACFTWKETTSHSWLSNSSWIDVVFRWGINPLAENKILFFLLHVTVNVAVHGIPDTRRQLPSLQKWSTFKRFEG